MKPSLPRFIYFTTEHGQYILCTEYPFVVGQVWKFTDEEAMKKKIEELPPTSLYVEGYNVFINELGTLTEHDFETKQTLFEMSSFFLSRINERPMGWRRYKIEKP